VRGLDVYALHIYCIVSTVALHSCEWRVLSASGVHCDQNKCQPVRVYSLVDFRFGRSAPLRLRVPGFIRNYARVGLEFDLSLYSLHACNSHSLHTDTHVNMYYSLPSGQRSLPSPEERPEDPEEPEDPKKQAALAKRAPRAAAKQKPRQPTANAKTTAAKTTVATLAKEAAAAPAAPAATKSKATKKPVATLAKEAAAAPAAPAATKSKAPKQPVAILAKQAAAAPAAPAAAVKTVKTRARNQSASSVETSDSDEDGEDEEEGISDSEGEEEQKNAGKAAKAATRTALAPAAAETKRILRKRPANSMNYNDCSDSKDDDEREVEEEEKKQGTDDESTANASEDEPLSKLRLPKLSPSAALLTSAKPHLVLAASKTAAAAEASTKKKAGANAFQKPRRVSVKHRRKPPPLPQKMCFYRDGCDYGAGLPNRGAKNQKKNPNEKRLQRVEWTNNTREWIPQHDDVYISTTSCKFVYVENILAKFDAGGVGYTAFPVLQADDWVEIRRTLDSQD
jgi:hypothetical protein